MSSIRNMKKNILSLAILLFMSLNIQAQFPGADRLRRKIVDKTVDKATDRAADRAADKIVDSIFGTEQPKTSSRGGERLDSAVTASARSYGSILGALNSAPAPDASYSFQSSYTMSLKNQDKKQGDILMKYLFSNTGTYFGTKTSTSDIQEMTMVFDFAKSSFYNFMNSNGQKTLMSFSKPGLGTSTADQSAESNPAEFKLTKTGQTKTILGYKCEQFKAVENDMEYFYWISSSKVPVISDQYKNLIKTAPIQGQNGMNMSYTYNKELVKMLSNGSAMLGMEFKDKKGNLTVMEVTEIKANDSFELKSAEYKNIMAGN